MLRLSEETYKLFCECGGFDFNDSMVQYDLWDVEDSYRRAGQMSVLKTEEPTYASKGGQLTYGWFPTFKLSTS